MAIGARTEAAGACDHGLTPKMGGSMLGRLNRIVAVLLAIGATSAPPLAHAIGDSGGCQPQWGPLQEALANGSAQDLERALEENHRGRIVSSSLRRMASNEPFAYGGCDGVLDAQTLLHVAVVQGNVETTRYLIDKGASPDLQLFRECRQPWKASPGIADKRRESFKLALLRSGLAKHKEVAHCRDNNVLQGYFQAGANAEVWRVEEELQRTIRTASSSRPEDTRKALERVRVFLVDGAMLRNQEVLRSLLSLCAAPVPDNAAACRDLASAAQIDYAALATEPRELDHLLRTCSAPYPWRVFKGDGNEDCHIVDDIAPLQYGQFKAALQHSEAGRTDQYEKAMRNLWKTMDGVDPRYMQYKSAVLFHLARSAGLSCRSDAEELLKRAFAYQKDLEKEYSSVEIDKRVFELAYFYFDKRRYSEALPLFERFYFSHKAHFPGVDGYAQLHHDMAQTYSAVGNARKAAESKKGADELRGRVRSWDPTFERRKYPASCLA